MADSRVDVILEFLRRNNFARAEAALRSEIDNRPDLNGFMQNLNLEEKDPGGKLLEKVNTAKPQKSSSASDEVSKEKHIVKEIESGPARNGPDSKLEFALFDEEHNNEPIGVKNENFIFSNGSEDNLLDLYTWRYNPNNGLIDPCDNDDNIITENVKEYQISSQSKIHPSEVADTEKNHRKVKEETNFSDGKVSFLGPVGPVSNNNKTNFVSKDDFADNPWSKNDEFKHSSSELWKNCSVKTVFPFPESDASTSYNNNNKDGKQKTDNINIRAAIKEQENEIGRALYFGKTNELQSFGGLSLPTVSENQKEELPRLPPVKLKSTEKLSSLTWEEKHEHDGPAQILTADNAFLIGSFLDVPIGQEISSSGLKRPVGGSWRSISQGITEDNCDLVSGFATIGDDYPNEYWDSDEYDDDEDVGYMRQPIEDETWFLAHEIDYPSDNEKGTILSDPQPNKNQDNDNDDQSFAEEDSYISGEQYFHSRNVDLVNDSVDHVVQYDGELMDEEELSLMSAEPVWQGFVAPANELLMFGEGNESERARLPEIPVDDEQLGSVRSIGVGINSDVADFGSENDLEYFNDNDSEKKHIQKVKQEKKSTKNVNEGGFSFPPPRDSVVSSKPSWSKSKSESNNDSSSPGKSSREEEDDDDDVLGSEISGPSNYGPDERAHFKKEENEKVGELIEEDEEAVAVQEQVKQIKAQEEEYETFNLKIIHRKNRTGFEEDKNFHVVLNSVIAGRYHVTEYLGSAAFSKAIQAHDLHTGMDVCVKIIKNNKDFF